MKKLRLGLLSVLLAVIGLCSLVGCGGSKVGVYKFDSMEVTQNGETKTLKVGDKFDLVLGLSFEIKEDLYTMELKEDGTFSISVGQTGLSGATSGKWKENEEDSGKIDLTPGGTVECKGGKITMELGGNKVILKK